MRITSKAPHGRMQDMQHLMLFLISFFFFFFFFFFFNKFSFFGESKERENLGERLIKRNMGEERREIERQNFIFFFSFFIPIY